MSFGVDYAWGRPSTDSLLNAKVTFACRYLSHDTTGKNLDLAEAKRLSKAGISCVVVWETTAQRPLAGHDAGVQDARDALRLAQSCGMPDNRPIYFAADWDATAGQQATISAYLDGVASIIGREWTGLYGGYGPIKRSFDAGKITWGWQTYAWSGGNWDSRAQIQQYSNDHVIGGVGLDYDRSTKSDFGQWKVGESFMALTPTDVKNVWTTDDIVANPTSGDPNAFWTPAYHLTNLGQHVRALETAITKLQGDVATLLGESGVNVDESAIVAGVLAGLNPDQLAEHIATALGPDVASQTLDALKSRLEA